MDFVPLYEPISSMFRFEDPLASYWCDSNGQINNIPCTILFKGMDFILHNLSPTFMFDGLMISFRFCRDINRQSKVFLG